LEKFNSLQNRCALASHIFLGVAAFSTQLSFHGAEPLMVEDKAFDRWGHAEAKDSE
jgi:hypothetical protein